MTFRMSSLGKSRMAHGAGGFSGTEFMAVVAVVVFLRQRGRDHTKVVSVEMHWRSDVMAPRPTLRHKIVSDIVSHGPRRRRRRRECLWLTGDMDGASCFRYVFRPYISSNAKRNGGAVRAHI